jgi:hypothetical protein
MTVAQISALRVAPASDRRRVHLQIEVTDISDPPPYLELVILDPERQPVAQMLVMGTADTPIEVTLHLRPAPPAGETRPYSALGRLFVGQEGAEEETLAQSEVSFALP